MAKVYLMIEDFQHEGKEGIDWGVEWGLEEGEELPEDVEELTLAQYTVWQLMTVLRQVGNSNEKAKIAD